MPRGERELTYSLIAKMVVDNRAAKKILLENLSAGVDNQHKIYEYINFSIQKGSKYCSMIFNYLGN